MSQAQQQSSEIIRFQANIPVEGALKFPEGLPVQGQYGDQVLFTFTDGRRAYCPPIVQQRIRELGVERGDAIVITKRSVRSGNRNSIEWSVERPLEKQIERSLAVVAERKAAVMPTTAEPTPAAPAASSYFSERMTAALMAAVDSAQAAESYAKTRGMNLKFQEEDVRAIAATIYIQDSRMAVRA